MLFPETELFELVKADILSTLLKARNILVHRVNKHQFYDEACLCRVTQMNQFNGCHTCSSKTRGQQIFTKIINTIFFGRETVFHLRFPGFTSKFKIIQLNSGYLSSSNQCSHDTLQQIHDTYTTLKRQKFSTEIVCIVSSVKYVHNSQGRRPINKELFNLKYKMKMLDMTL